MRDKVQTLPSGGRSLNNSGGGGHFWKERQAHSHIIHHYRQSNNAYIHIVPLLPFPFTCSLPNKTFVQRLMVFSPSGLYGKAGSAVPDDELDVTTSKGSSSSSQIESSSEGGLTFVTKLFFGAIIVAGCFAFVKSRKGGKARGWEKTLPWFLNVFDDRSVAGGLLLRFGCR